MILRSEYKAELLDWLTETPDKVFQNKGLKKEAVLADEMVIDRLWAAYQKGIEEYRCDPWWSYQDSLKDILGIDYDALSRYSRDNGSNSQLPPAWHLPGSRWIPVKERLPEKPEDLDDCSAWQEYMCKVRMPDEDGRIRKVACTFTMGGNWMRYGRNWNNCVLAWQELPYDEEETK